MIKLYKSVFLVTVVSLGIYFGFLLGPQLVDCTPLNTMTGEYRDEKPPYKLACSATSIVFSLMFMGGLISLFRGVLGPEDA